MSFAEKLKSRTVSLISRSFGAIRAELPVIIACYGAFVVLVLLPLFFGGEREDGYFTYKFMWLNLLGHHFSLMPETPKPLFALLCGILPHQALYPTMCAFAAGVLALLMKISKHIGASYGAGLVAFLLFIFANRTVLPEFILSASYPMLYFFLILASVYFFVTKRAHASSAFLLGAGLLRPEAWVIPVVFAAATLFKKERGFSWALCFPLIAPLLWALFDLRIAGSLTFSADVTHRDLLTLQAMPVSFAEFWPAEIENVARSFSPFAHLFGLAGLCYLSIRRRKAEHVLLAALAVMPFLVFWLSTFVKPVVIHVRYFSFPMLVCCLYAAMVLSEGVRNRWPRIFLFAGLLSLAFRPGLLGDCRKMVAADRIIMDERESSLPEVEKRINDSEIILCGRSVSFFCYHLGEKASAKIMQFREIIYDPKPLQCVTKGIAVYIQGDLGGSDGVFLSLAVPRACEIGPFAFSPISTSPGNTCIVYSFQRLPGHPLPQSCQ